MNTTVLHKKGVGGVGNLFECMRTHVPQNRMLEYNETANSVRYIQSNPPQFEYDPVSGSKSCPKLSVKISII